MAEANPLGVLGAALTVTVEAVVVRNGVVVEDEPAASSEESR